MGPLAGKRIIEFGGIGPGPFCGMLFADMGAEVIVIQEKMRSESSEALTMTPRSALVNRDKKSIDLDLARGRDRDVTGTAGMV